MPEAEDRPRAQELTAQNLYRSTLMRPTHNLFRIPKNYKKLYAARLKVKDDAPEIDKILCEDIDDILKTGVTEENYVRFFHNLLWYEETIIRINLKNYNMSNVPLSRLSDCFVLTVPGLAEKRPSLVLGDLLFVKPSKTSVDMFEGVITDIKENVVFIRGLHHEFSKYFSSDAGFDIRFFLSRTSLERMHHAIHSIVKAGHTSKIFPQKNPRIINIKAIDRYFNASIEQNAEQRSVVEHIVAGTSGHAPYLVHGPPGTGKTVTIVEAILQLVKKSPKNRIMVCTDSNMAADHVATMLIKYARNFQEKNFLLRANSKYRVWESMPECLVEYSNGQDRSDYETVSLEKFMAHRIVVATLSHSAIYAKYIKGKGREYFVSHMFIDEAAQASEPVCLIPVSGLLAPSGHLVLAGDPHQLGPVIISHNVSKLGLGLSLMERLIKSNLYSDDDPNYMVMLRNNFRSNPDILEIPNKLFYKGQLRACAKPDLISNIDILGEDPQSRAVIFHGVLSQEQKVGKSPSFFNSMELEIVQMYITFLVNDHNVLQEDIGIVTPYIRQVYTVKTWLQKEGYNKIEVGTVESFQGKEKRIIIISTVRANCGLLNHDAKYQLGFLVDDKRFNVALTRAKAKVIIIGNPVCLQKDEKWRTYIEKCRASGTYRGYAPELMDIEKTSEEIVNRAINKAKQQKKSQK